jgi:hypothetical protein
MGSEDRKWQWMQENLDLIKQEGKDYPLHVVFFFVNVLSLWNYIKTEFWSFVSKF